MYQGVDECIHTRTGMRCPKVATTTRQHLLGWHPIDDGVHGCNACDILNVTIAFQNGIHDGEATDDESTV